MKCMIMLYGSQQDYDVMAGKSTDKPPMSPEQLAEMHAAIGQWFRYLVGTLELAGAIGLLIPRLRMLAATGLFVLLVAASLTNIAVLGVSPLSALIWAALVAAVMHLRRDELSASPVSGGNLT